MSRCRKDVDDCPQVHCGICAEVHVDATGATCPGCIGVVRGHLRRVRLLVPVAELWLDGWPTRSPGCPQDGSRAADSPLPGGDLLVMLSGGSEGRSALGRFDAMNDVTAHHDPPSIVWTLAAWETTWRQRFNDPPGAWPVDLDASADYLDRRLTRAAAEAGFGDFVRELTDLHHRLERALAIVVRDETSPVPCLTCGTRALIRRWTDAGIADDWLCRCCRRIYPPRDYWLAIMAYETERAEGAA